MNTYTHMIVDCQAHLINRSHEDHEDTMIPLEVNKKAKLKRRRVVSNSVIETDVKGNRVRRSQI